MLPAETKKKFIVGVTVGAAILGGLFMVWAIFLNRGTVTITAQSPYILTIENLKNVPCSSDICSSVVAPGKYTITLQKVGYKSEVRTIDVPWHGEYQENVSFQFIPVLSQKTARQLFAFSGDLSTINIVHFPELAQKIQKSLANISLLITKTEPEIMTNMPIVAASVKNIIFAPDARTAIVNADGKISLYNFEVPTLVMDDKISFQEGQQQMLDHENQIIKPLALPDTTPIFYDSTGRYIALIKRAENFRQALFLQHLNEKNELEEPVMVTSFLRDLQDPIISVAPNHEKIAIIDHGDQSATLYLVDVTAKNRQNLFSYSDIKDVKWFAESDRFLFEARAEKSLTDSVFLYNPGAETEEQKIKMLDLKTPLKDVAIVDQNNLIAATTQAIPGSDQPENLEGKIVTLGDQEIFTNTQPLLAFLDYSLVANQGRLIKGVPNETLPDAIQLSADQSTLYILQGDMLSTLKFKE